MGEIFDFSWVESFGLQEALLLGTGKIKESFENYLEIEDKKQKPLTKFHDEVF